MGCMVVAWGWRIQMVVRRADVRVTKCHKMSFRPTTGNRTTLNGDAEELE